MDWSSPVTFLLLFIIGLISSEPRICRDQNALNERMDAVQKRVEDTVQQLEVGLADLLETIGAADWRPLVDENGDPLPKHNLRQ